jgi:uncharacterized protein (DUF2237 family)
MKVSIVRNVLGGPLQPCSFDPLTGWRRDGCCHTDAHDLGGHTVCARMTPAFLNHQLERGNDLITPRPALRFPGLKPGDRWCVCVRRWREAYENGYAPPVVLECTHERTLDVVPLEWLREHAWPHPEASDA